jgi:hypothetical protein
MCLLFDDATEAFQVRLIRKRRSEVVNSEQKSVRRPGHLAFFQPVIISAVSCTEL